jgi:hypothetical protein
LCARTTFNIYVFIRTTIDLSDANILSTFLEIKIQLVNTPKYNEQYLLSFIFNSIYNDSLNG